MNLRLVERRTDTKVVSCVPENEGSCMECLEKNTVEPLAVLRANIHDLRDKRGNVMMENEVSCSKCGAKWVDVFCRVYPVVVDSPDKQEEE